MLIAEARVETERPSRYLAQLCRHVQEAAQGRHVPQAAHGRHEQEGAHAHRRMPPRVEWSDTHGVIDFGSGRCTLRAEPGALVLQVEAPDEETLRWVQHRLSDRLERFGRRDRLTVSWSSAQGGGRSSQEPVNNHN
jgi:hypothetical protein